MRTLSLALALSISLSSYAQNSSSAPAPTAQTATSQTQTIHPLGNHVTVNGAKLWYESEGSGPPILLIAGGPGFAPDYFHPHFLGLAKFARVIYFDSFGRGKSDRAGDQREYSFARDVEDVEALRKALGLEKITVLGHSYGGMVAQAYALRFPDPVQKLILVDTIFSGEMWQANNDNSNYEIRNQYPEVWEKIHTVRDRGFHTCTKECQDASQVPVAFLYFYDTSTMRRDGAS